ncbi:MAG: hypothetical protein ACPG8W_17020 [Candidatus Promineifilaceae bacterium]
MMLLSRTQKTFLLTTIGLALGVHNIAFTLGVYNTIFFDHLLSIWAVSIAVLLGILSLPSGERPIKPAGLFALAAPTFWIVLSLFGNLKNSWSGIDELIFVLSACIIFIVLPYTGYLIISITQAEALTIAPKRLLYYLIGIALFVGILSYLLGAYNYYLFTCENFTIAGYNQPANCYTPTK